MQENPSVSRKHDMLWRWGFRDYKPWIDIPDMKLYSDSNDPGAGRYVHTIDLLLILKLRDSTIWGRSSWSEEKPLPVFREDPAATGVAEASKLLGGISNRKTKLQLSDRFFPLKVTSFKLLLDLKSRWGGTLVSKAVLQNSF